MIMKTIIIYDLMKLFGYVYGFVMQKGLLELESHIRKGDEPDSPLLVDTYLRRIEHASSLLLSTYEKVSLYIHAARLLLDTVCDCFVVTHWRHHCLNQIYRPLLAAQRMVTCDDEDQLIRQFQRELNILAQYFL